MLPILNEILRRCDVGEPVGVCVVAQTQGSTPQKSGAVMLVLQSGQTLGTLGGGCVEAEVRRRALEQMSARKSAMLTFKLDHDYGWDDGLVCGGTMRIAVLIAQSPDDAQPWRTAQTQLLEGSSATLDLSAAGPAGEPVPFNLALEPIPMLVIAGAGHVGQALGSIARGIGFDLTVIDDRPDYANPTRFPDARCVVGPIELELGRLTVTPHTYIVIVTRGHKHDAQALAAVINSPARYVGLIGSKRKIITILRDLKAQGIPDAAFHRLHSPIGLDIGAITPQEIALSIAAELIASRRGVSKETIPSLRLTADQLRQL